MAVERESKLGIWEQLMGILVTAALMVVAGCSQTQFNKIPDAEVDATQKAAAEKFGAETLSAWAQDKYPKVRVPADPKFKAGQEDETRQRAADKSIEGKYGDFQSMSFFEAVKSEPAQFIVYRFQGKFSKSGEPLEVRVVYDTAGKLGGFWIKPWNDTLG